MGASVADSEEKPVTKPVCRNLTLPCHINRNIDWSISFWLNTEDDTCMVAWAIYVGTSEMFQSHGGHQWSYWWTFYNFKISDATNTSEVDLKLVWFVEATMMI